MSTILFKFRSGKIFQALPLPGSSARLFDVKKAIVEAKKLDAGSLEFDLSVMNAATSEEYADESMLLPRGTRIIVQRLPAARGHGFLARMARNQWAGGVGQNSAAGCGLQSSGMMGAGGGNNASGTPSGFYTIGGSRDEDEEFVQSNSGKVAGSGQQWTALSSTDLEDKELAALKAVTDTAASSAIGGVMGGALRPSTAGYRSGGGPGAASHAGAAGGSMMNAAGVGGSAGVAGGAGGPQSCQGAGPGGNFQASKQRQNADPELSEQERKLLPKMRGIPRTFLNLQALSAMDGNKATDGEENDVSMPLLQPNILGFAELLNRGGGQSESAIGTKRDLDYALEVTATSIPEYLQCGICQGVVKNAVLLPWDSEGRTSCETCIRDALTNNGFRCPLTGIEGVSPDELHPNIALRKAAESFVKKVMEKVEEIEKQQILEEEGNPSNGKSTNKNNFFEGDGGMILSKRTTGTKKKKEEDPFGNTDEFGGDVFDVEAEKEDEAGDDDEIPKDDPFGVKSNDEKKSQINSNTTNNNPDIDNTIAPSQNTAGAICGSGRSGCDGRKDDNEGKERGKEMKERREGRGSGDRHDEREDGGCEGRRFGGEREDRGRKGGGRYGPSSSDGPSPYQGRGRGREGPYGGRFGRGEWDAGRGSGGYYDQYKYGDGELRGVKRPHPGEHHSGEDHHFGPGPRLGGPGGPPGPPNGNYVVDPGRGRGGPRGPPFRGRYSGPPQGGGDGYRGRGRFSRGRY